MTIDKAEIGSLAATPKTSRSRSNWTLLSNHGHVLICIATDPDIRLRDIATRVGITERAVFGIVEDLEVGGIIQRVKVGRRNRYLINVDAPLRHEIEANHTVGALIGLFAWSSDDLKQLDKQTAGKR